MGRVSWQFLISCTGGKMGIPNTGITSKTHHLLLIGRGPGVRDWLDIFMLFSHLSGNEMFTQLRECLKWAGWLLFLDCVWHFWLYKDRRWQKVVNWLCECVVPSISIERVLSLLLPQAEHRLFQDSLLNKSAQATQTQCVIFSFSPAFWYLSRPHQWRRDECPTDAYTCRQLKHHCRRQ